MMNRRSFIQGIIAVPAIVRSASLMPIRGIVMSVNGFDMQASLNVMAFVADWEEVAKLIMPVRAVAVAYSAQQIVDGVIIAAGG